VCVCINLDYTVCSTNQLQHLSLQLFLNLQDYSVLSVVVVVLYCTGFNVITLLSCQ